MTTAKSIFCKEKNVYMTTINVSGDYRINNVYAINIKNPPYVFQTNKLPKIEKINIKNYIEKYIHCSGKEVSPSEYNFQLDKFKKNKTYCECDEEYQFNSLEDEYEYKKFIRDHTAIYREVNEFTEIVVEYIPIQYETNNKYITPVMTLTNDLKFMYKYDRLNCKKETFFELMKKYDIVYSEEPLSYNDYWNYSGGMFCYTDKDDLQKLSINNSFVNYDFFKQNQSFYGELDKCEKLYNEDVKITTDSVNNHLAKHTKIKTKTLPSDISNTLLNNLTELQRLNKDIVPVQKSNHKYRECSNLLKTTIDQLTTFIIDNYLNKDND